MRVITFIAICNLLERQIAHVDMIFYVLTPVSETHTHTHTPPTKALTGATVEKPVLPEGSITREIRQQLPSVLVQEGSVPRPPFTLPCLLPILSLTHRTLCIPQFRLLPGSRSVRSRVPCLLMSHSSSTTTLQSHGCLLC